MKGKSYLKEFKKMFLRIKNLSQNIFLKKNRYNKQFQKPIKLNIGCGDMYLDGWINIDCNVFHKVDLLIDLKDTHKFFSNNSVNTIMLLHSISYLNLWEARDCFLIFFNLLEDGGKLIFEFPDTVKCSKAIMESNMEFNKYIESLRAFYAFDLEQIDKREKYMPYTFGWTGWHIQKELSNVGFSKVEILQPQTHGKRELRDTRIEATK